MSSEPQFDTRAFLKAHWPGSAQMHAWLQNFSVNAEKQTVYKWWVRASIPAETFAVVLCLLELERGPVSLAKFLR